MDLCYGYCLRDFDVCFVSSFSLYEMGDKKKAGSILVRLVSAAGTGFFYVVRKSRRFQNTQTKLEFRKYDPRVKRHVLFTEAKMK